MSIVVVSFDAWRTLVKPNKAYTWARAELIVKAVGWTGDLEAGIALVGQAKNELDALTDDTGIQYGFEPRVLTACRLMGLSELAEAPLARLTVAALRLHLEMLPSLMEFDLPGVFEQLRTAGLRLAVISNTGFTSGVVLEAALGQLGLRPDHGIYSDQLGFAKPSLEIFAHLAKVSDCQPQEILHVGDNAKADVAGATAAGLNALLYNPGGQSGPDVYTSHTQLPGRVREFNSA